MKLTKKLLALTLALVLVLALAACGKTDTPDPAVTTERAICPWPESRLPQSKAPRAWAWFT